MLSVRGEPGAGKTTLLDHQWISLNDASTALEAVDTSR
jgi:hypothetical protein